MPIDRIITASIQDGAVVPADLSTGGPSWDTSGNVGIGTSSPTRKLTVYGNTAQVDLSIVSSTTGLAVIHMGDTAADNQGQIIYRNDTDAMTFTVNAAERMRIDSNGNLLVGTTSSTGALERLNVSRGGSSLRVVHFENTRNVSGDENVRVALGSNCNNTSSYHIVCTTGGADRFYVYGNGNVANSNNSYGAISDAKLKENVVDATPKLEKLNQVRVVNFNMIGDEQKQIGVVAQELEQIFPGMVEETPDRDEKGNNIGTTTKSVKYSVFVPMLIKAIQEQQQMIETLQAKVAALEAK